MKKILFLATILMLSFLFAGSTMAYVTNRNSDEMLNSRAVKLARVVYPTEARKNKIQGTVLVKVTVNEKGKVTGAEMTEGNPVFKDACEKAALASTFKPKIQNGKRVKFSGTLKYSFSIYQ